MSQKISIISGSKVEGGAPYVNSEAFSRVKPLHEQSITIAAPDFDSKNILQSFLIKTNIEINLDNLANVLPAYIPILNLNESFETCRSGTIIALKYKNIVKGQDYLFKTKIGFKNTCHLIICYTLKNKKRIKKMVHIKITAVTFQVVGIPVVDVEKIIYKVFLLLEKINKQNIVFKYISAIEQKNRLEIVIVPILNNYMLTLNSKITNRIFQNSKVQISHKFIINNFISFMVPNDPAITIKKIFLYKDFCKHPIPYITWNKKFGQTIHYIEYDSYTTLLNNKQKINAQSDKYLTLRLHSSGKVLVSGFDETLVKEGIENFLTVCRQF